MIGQVFRHHTGFLLLVVILCLGGGLLMTRLPVLMYPQTQRSQVSVRISHPGISALDFKESSGELVESRLLGIEGLDQMTSTYSSDQSSFDLVFDWNINSDTARKAAESTMYTLAPQLGSDLEDSWQVRYRESENAGYIVLGAWSPTVPPEALYTLLKNGVEPTLSRIPQIEELGIYNVEELQASVTLNQEAMLARGVTINEVNSAMQTGIKPQALGTLREDNQRYSLRHIKGNAGLEAIHYLEITSRNGNTVPLKDIATIDIRYTVPNQVFMIGDQPAIQISATPVEGGNLNTLSAELLNNLEAARDQGRLPGDTEFVFYLDPASYIQTSIDSVVNSALLGGILAVVVVFFILGELRNTLVIAMSLPASILLNFILMYAFGMSLNLISLGGLALAVGMIVDSTIVVMENIHRWRLESTGPLLPHHWKHMVIDATRQVQGPVIASTLTSVLVFLPISFTSPLTNAILGDQARTVVFTLLCSMAVALTLVPLVAWLIFRRKTGTDPAHRRATTLETASAALMGRISGQYRRILGRLIASRFRAVLFLALSFGALVAAVLLVLPGIPREIMSVPQSRRVVVFFRHEQYRETAEIVEELLPQLNERIEKTLGSMVSQRFASIRGRFSQIFIDLKDDSLTPRALELLQAEFTTQGDWYFNILSWDPAALPLPMTNDLQVAVYGPDSEVKTQLLARMQSILQEARIYRRSYTRPSTSITNEVTLESRPLTMENFGTWTESSLLGLVRRILGGSTMTVQLDGQDLEISAEYPQEDLDRREKLENFLIPWKDSFIPLKHFFEFATRTGVSQLVSEDGQAIFRIYGSLGPQSSDAELGAARLQADRLFQEKLSLAPGYTLGFEEPRTELNQSLSSLFLALGISIILIYLLLAWQFNSLVIPLVILVTIPLGLLGVILSLRAFGASLNLNSLLGTILLGGVVVNNAIIMIDFHLKTRVEFHSPIEALVHAAGLRFQPILITTLTTVIGMLPIALGMGSGSKIIQGLGIAVSGGLAISTIFTLFAVPAILRLGYRTKAGHRPQAQGEAVE